MEQFKEAIRKEKAARRAAMPPQGMTDAAGRRGAAACAGAAGRIDRAWNDYVKGRTAREPGPRITQL